jgi:selenium-binding protein 1
MLLSPDSSKPDALAVIDVKPGSPAFSKIVHTVTMPYKGDEFHHFGWNACSSALSPLTGHASLERRYLIIPGLRSSRIYVVDTKPDPTRAKIQKIIEPEEVFKKTGYSRPHTVHCGPEGIYVSTLGGGGKDGTEGPPGMFIMDSETFDILDRWEIDRGPPATLVVVACSQIWVTSVISANFLPVASDSTAVKTVCTKSSSE